MLLLYLKVSELQNNCLDVFIHRYYFAKILNYFSLRFPNLGVAVFRKRPSVATFKVINIHSLFSFIFILLSVFTNRILEHFLFIILSLDSCDYQQIVGLLLFPVGIKSQHWE